MNAFIRPRWLTLCLLFTIVAIGVALRLPGLRGSLWLDELHTAWTVSSELEEVAPRAMLGNQPPVPYWLLWFYAKVVGVSEVTLRLPSLIASITAIVAIYVLVWRWTRSQASALLASFALAVHCDSFAFYGSEARVYALGQCLAIGHLLVFDEVLRGANWRARLSWIVGAWLLLYLHYTLALLVVAEVIAWAICRLLKRDLPYRWRHLACDAVLIGLGCLPALPHLRAIANRREAWDLFIPQAEWSDLAMIVPHENALWWLLAGWLGIVAVFWWKGERPAVLRGDVPALPLVIAWLCVPILLCWVGSYFNVVRLFYPRYLVYVVPAGGALLAVLAALLPQKPIRIGYTVAAAAILAGWNLWLCYAVYGGLSMPRNEDWRAAVAFLNQRDWQAGEPLLVATNLIEVDWLRSDDDPRLRAFCLYPLHALYRLQAEGIVEIPLPMTDAGKLSSTDQRIASQWLAQHASFVVLIRGDEAYAQSVCDQIAASLDAKSKTTRDFGGVQLFEISSR